jgi:hypothetical protein
MSRVFDNIHADLLPALRSTLQVSDRADFCVGYLNLRGWQAIDDLISDWDPLAGQVCRVLVGMQRPPHGDTIRDLYIQKQRVLDNGDDEVDLASHAWRVWKQATRDKQDLARAVEPRPPVVHSSKAFQLDESHFPLLGSDAANGGALVYVKSPEGNDRLAWLGANGKTVTESPFTVLRAAECLPDTPAVQRLTRHHGLVAGGLRQRCGWRPGPPKYPPSPNLRASQGFRHRTDAEPVPRRRA